MNSKITKIAILCSGSGSNAQKIMEHFQHSPDIKVEILLSNSDKAFALERARNFGVPTQVFSRDSFYHSTQIIELLKEKEISWIVLAGFLWLMPENIINEFPNRIINIHPALLPSYGGKGMYGMFVHMAIHDAQEEETGITIHFVNNDYDEGEIIFQAKCAIDNTDTPESIAKKVQVLEHQHYSRIIEEVIKKQTSKI